MNNTLYVPDLKNNLYSITRATSEGASLSNENDVLVFKWSDKEL